MYRKVSKTYCHLFNSHLLNEVKKIHLLAENNAKNDPLKSKKNNQKNGNWRYIKDIFDTEIKAIWNDYEAKTRGFKTQYSTGKITRFEMIRSIKPVWKKTKSSIHRLDLKRQLSMVIYWIEQQKLVLNLTALAYILRKLFMKFNHDFCKSSKDKWRKLNLIEDLALVSGSSTGTACKIGFIWNKLKLANLECFALWDAYERWQEIKAGMDPDTLEKFKLWKFSFGGFKWAFLAHCKQLEKANQITSDQPEEEDDGLKDLSEQSSTFSVKITENQTPKVDPNATFGTKIVW